MPMIRDVYLLEGFHPVGKNAWHDGGVSLTRIAHSQFCQLLHLNEGIGI